MTSAQIILVDDEEDIRLSVQQSLELRGHEVRPFARAERALERLNPDFPGVIVSDIRMPRMDGLALLDAVRQLDADLPVILITGHGDVPLAVEALRNGAYDFIEKPFSTDRLVQAIERAAEKRRLTLELRHLKNERPDDDPLEAIILGRAPAMVDLRRKIRTVAASDLDVLIVGETGTGKELVARSIHQLSDSRNRPFVTINLAALPAATIESELFGHIAGAFPGAVRARTGRLEHARGGTVYLDEIGAAPLALQVKLLRMIEDRAIEPLGTSERIDLDVRFFASTKEDLQQQIETGQFRDDLLYRINPVTLRLPPLRDRAEDIPRLFQRFVADATDRFSRPSLAVPPERLLSIATEKWPGNLRELRHEAERYVLGIDGDHDETANAEFGLVAQLERFERSVIAAALAANDGNLKATYELLGLSRKTLYEKMQKHGLSREDYEI